MPQIAIYAIYTYAAAHACHDVYVGGKWAYNKFKNRKKNDGTNQNQQAQNQQAEPQAQAA